MRTESEGSAVLEISQFEIEAKGERILRLADAPGLFAMLKPATWLRRLMESSMADESLKVQTLRFVDVLPALRGNAEVIAHMREYFAGGGASFPIKLALRFGGLLPWAVAAAVRTGVGGMARQFITGQTGARAIPVLKKRRAAGIGFTVDILGEAVVSEPEADAYLLRYLELIESLAVECRQWAPIPRLDGGAGHGRATPKVNVSVKISALYSQIHPDDPTTAIVRLKDRLRPLLRRAKALGAFINLDMEAYAVKDLTLDLFESLLDEPEFAGHDDVGIVIQAYLRDSAADFERMLAWARQRGRRLTIRLVKGAYWDYEGVIARQRGWPIPVYLRKPETDANFERISRRMLQSAGHIYSAFGTHNVRSMAHAIVAAGKCGLGPRDYEIQMLYGMAEPIKRALVQMGHRVREYCPVGELLPGMAYLVRRLLENTSNEGFLKAKFTDRLPSSELLRDPATLLGNTGSPPSDGCSRPVAPGRRESLPPNGQPAFANEPLIDFTRAENRAQMSLALDAERAAFGRDWPLVISGCDIPTHGWITSINPARPSQVIGRAGRATPAQARDAIAAAVAAAPGWRATPAPTRAALLERMAALIQAERFRLAALEVYEVGKPWIEADADVAEAIDFCRFYACEMRRLAEPQVTQHVPGEHCTQEYMPRGVGVVIAPWNFPLAILTGMTAAALVTGNTVIMKPAEQSTLVGARLMDIARRAGLPAGVLNLVSGLGEEIGDCLVNHPKVDFIAFTGSKEVGLRIWETGGRTRPDQSQLKRVVCEMGGKNALIVDSDADLDDAIGGIVYSAFGYQGQKCSALSRLILLEQNHDAVLRRLVEAAACLSIGFPDQPGIVVGPLIDAEAHQRVRRYVEIGKTEARIAFEGTIPAELAGGYFAAPTIFTDVPPTARLAREEIFGPVLAVLKARDLGHALQLANDCEFALTGGFYSRSPANIERVKRELLVGNLYINRGITGAVVERHPFGGFKLSGGGTKAGGRDYLLNFLFPRVIAENIVRRGFAPVE